MTQAFLETARLYLRPFTEADVENLFELDADPEVMRFVGGKPTPRQVIEHELLPGYLSYYRRGDRYGFWAAIEKASGHFLGWFHFRPLDGAGLDEPELGYRLRVDAWGKGYATELSLALIRKGFAEMGVARVVASTFVDNLASRRVLEKCGLQIVHSYHLCSEELGEGDALEYVLESAEWERLEAARSTSC